MNETKPVRTEGTSLPRAGHDEGQMRGRVLVTGANGQLGRALMTLLPQAGFEPTGVDLPEVDISDAAAMSSWDWTGYDVIINAAAWTNVDGAETPEGRRLSWRANTVGPVNLARAAVQHGLTLVHLSTEYTFDGVTAVHTEEETPSPLGVYGQSKAAGDAAVSVCPRHYLVRTSWVVGDGKNFVKSMLQLAKTNKILSIVNDQIGSPTYTRDLAPLLADILESEKYGIYHATNEGFCSWAQFAREIFRQAGVAVNVTNVPSHMYPTKATRPKNSRLSKKSLDDAGFHRLPPWEDAVGRFLKELKQAGE